LPCKFAIDMAISLFLLNFSGLTVARNVLFSLTKRGLGAGSVQVFNDFNGLARVMCCRAPPPNFLFLLSFSASL